MKQYDLFTNKSFCISISEWIAVKIVAIPRKSVTVKYYLKTTFFVISTLVTERLRYDCNWTYGLSSVNYYPRLNFVFQNSVGT